MIYLAEIEAIEALTQLGSITWEADGRHLHARGHHLAGFESLHLDLTSERRVTLHARRAGHPEPLAASAVLGLTRRSRAIHRLEETAIRSTR